MRKIILFWDFYGNYFTAKNKSSLSRIGVDDETANE